MVACLAVTVMFGSGIWFLLGHPVFAITRVVILGRVHTPQGELELAVESFMHTSRLLIFRQSNRFLFDVRALEQAVQEQFHLARVVARQQTGTVELTMEERTSNLLWETDGQTYVVDLQGLVVREALPQDRGLTLPLFIDENDLAVTLGTQVMEPKEIENVFRFQKRIGEFGIDFTKTKVNRVAGKWMGIVTMEGYEIYLDASGDIDRQTSNLATLLGQQTVDRTTIEYIDLRFGDQVYYK